MDARWLRPIYANPAILSGSIIGTWRLEMFHASSMLHLCDFGLANTDKIRDEFCTGSGYNSFLDTEVD